MLTTHSFHSFLSSIRSISPFTEFWAGPGAPVFVFIGGEGEESCSRLTERMYLWDLAKENNALLMNVEHRFYGESYPTKDMSTKNLQYLSSQQGLADLARVITQVKKDLGTESRLVRDGITRFVQYASTFYVFIKTTSLCCIKLIHAI